MRVLIIDDEANVRELVRLYLASAGHEVLEAADGPAGVAAALTYRPDFVVLDIMLPGLDGWEVCRRIRADLDVPLVMLTAKGDEVDRIMGLEMGADDYLTKPFSPGELIARIRAVARRARLAADAPPGQTVRGRRLLMSLDSRSAELDRHALPLTPKEFDLLWFLASQPTRAFSRETILEQVWGYDFMGDLRTVDAHVKRLRQKLEPDGADRLIYTVWGVGYKYEEKHV